MRKKSVSAPLIPDSHRLDYGTTGETSTSPVRKLLQRAGAAEILVHQVAQMPHVQGWSVSSYLISASDAQLPARAAASQQHLVAQLAVAAAKFGLTPLDYEFRQVKMGWCNSVRW